MALDESRLQDFGRIMTSVGISNPPDCWLKSYEMLEESTYTVDEQLDIGVLAQFLSLVELDEDCVRDLKETLDIVRTNDDLKNLVWLWHYCVFVSGEEQCNNWPLPDLLPEHLRSLFHLVVYITGIPVFLKIHADYNIPIDITRNCLKDMPWRTRYYKDAQGRWGLAELGWLKHILLGNIFRLRRLQFKFIPYYYDYHLYRNLKNRRILALAGNGMQFRTDGLINGTNGISDEHFWTSSLCEENRTVTGYPMLSVGQAVNERLTIDLDDWEQILVNGNNILEVHIPGGEKMDYQECIESFHLANEFFQKYLHKAKHVGFVCTSWLLDPNMPKILPAESNIVKFQKEFYLMPVLSDDNQTFGCVFGSKPEDLTTASRDTSLRRAILDHILSGNNMHGAAGFIPADEIGQQHNYYL